MIIIGIDPGTVITGYGIIKIMGSKYQVLDFGCIRPPAKLKLSNRYHIIFDSLEELLKTHQPTVAVVETQFTQINPKTAMKLSMARAMAILAARRSGISIHEYSPSRAKKAVVGNGQASKQQVQAMMKHILNLPSSTIPEDAADALALAVCHAQTIHIPHSKSTEI